MVECFPSWSSHHGLCTWENVNSWCVKSVRYWGCYSMNLKQEIKKTTKTAKPKGNGRRKEKSKEQRNGKQRISRLRDNCSFLSHGKAINWLPNPGLGPLVKRVAISPLYSEEHTASFIYETEWAGVLVSCSSNWQLIFSTWEEGVEAEWADRANPRNKGGQGLNCTKKTQRTNSRKRGQK